MPHMVIKMSLLHVKFHLSLGKVAKPLAKTPKCWWIGDIFYIQILQTPRFHIVSQFHWLHPLRVYMGVSQNEAAGTGSLSQGSVSWVCFVGLFRGMFRGSVSHSSSTSHNEIQGVCFGVCFEGLFRGMFRGSVSPKSNFPALLKVALLQKIQTHIYK